jgi:hypothetical protein
MSRARCPFTAYATVGVLDQLVRDLGQPPRHVRMDNGPELTAHALADWCRFTGVDLAYIDPGSPWQNGICESFQRPLPRRVPGPRTVQHSAPTIRAGGPPTGAESAAQHDGGTGPAPPIISRGTVPAERTNGSMSARIAADEHADEARHASDFTCKIEEW